METTIHLVTSISVSPVENNKYVNSFGKEQEYTYREITVKNEEGITFTLRLFAKDEAGLKF